VKILKNLTAFGRHQLLILNIYIAVFSINLYDIFPNSQPTRTSTFLIDEDAKISANGSCLSRRFLRANQMNWAAHF